MIHLEGMGIMGCYIALRLEADGVEFTWHDSRERIQAWRASTGAIFPTGDPDEQWALHTWVGHLMDDRFAPWMETASYVYSTLHPPHGGRYGFEDLGPVRVAHTSSLHLNAQSWVPEVRKRFLRERLDAPPHDSEIVVVTHGFGARLARFMWGWTVPVRLRCKQEWSQRQALYFRRGRFTMAYAYPIPGTDMWYAGSSLISQRSPKSLAIEDKFLRWRRTFTELGGGHVLGVARAGLPIQGWRPVPAAGDDAWIERVDGRLTVKPCWHSGIRHAPLAYRALTEAL